MKKVLTTLLLMLAMSANAQINNLDEIEIQGKWDVYGFGGSFSNFPFEICFYLLFIWWVLT